MQGYPGTPGTVQATQPGTAFKKSRFVKYETMDTYLSIRLGGTAELNLKCVGFEEVNFYGEYSRDG